MKKKSTKKTPAERMGEKDLQARYRHDNAAYFRDVREGYTPLETAPGPYCGFRAWSDGYKAGLAARKPGKRT